MAKPKPIEDMFKNLTTKQKMITLGWKLIDMIKARTIKGEGVDGDFKSYSNKRISKDGKKYTPFWILKKHGGFKRQATGFKPNTSKDVNLILTSDMLNSFQVKKGSTNDKQVTIGFPPAESQKAFGQEKQGRVISSTRRPVREDEEEFIAQFFDKRIKKAMKDSSGRTELING